MQLACNMHVFGKRPRHFDGRGEKNKEKGIVILVVDRLENTADLD